MNTKQLRTFLKVARLGSMSKAAEEVFLSTSAVKKQMDALEAELGCDLFARGSKGCTLTPSGEAFRDEAASLAEHLELVRNSVARDAQDRFTICDMQNYSIRLQDLFLMRFASLFPDIEVRHIARPRSQWIAALQTGEADTCLCVHGASVREPGRQGSELRRLMVPRDGFSGLEAHWFSDERSQQCLVVSPLSPLAERTSIGLDEMRGLHVMTDPFSYSFGCLKEIAREHGFTAEADDVVDKRRSSIDYCAGGGALVTNDRFADFLSPLVKIPIEGYELFWCYLARPHMNEATARFVTFLSKSNPMGA